MEPAAEEVKALRHGVHEDLIFWRPRAAGKEREDGGWRLVISGVWATINRRPGDRFGFGAVEDRLTG